MFHMTRKHNCRGICNNCCKLLTSNWIAAMRSFHLIWIVSNRSLVKRTPDLWLALLSKLYCQADEWNLTVINSQCISALIEFALISRNSNSEHIQEEFYEFRGFPFIFHSILKGSNDDWSSLVYPPAVVAELLPSHHLMMTLMHMLCQGNPRVFTHKWTKVFKLFASTSCWTHKTHVTFWYWACGVMMPCL